MPWRDLEIWRSKGFYSQKITDQLFDFSYMQYIKRQFYFPEKPGMQKRFNENTKTGKKRNPRRQATTQ